MCGLFIFTTLACLSSADSAQKMSGSSREALWAGVGVPLMAAGGGAGAITVWNLETRRLHTVIRDAHDAPLLSLHFFPGEPRLMSSAGDNSLKQVHSITNAWGTRVSFVMTQT